MRILDESNISGRMAKWQLGDWSQKDWLGLRQRYYFERMGHDYCTALELSLSPEARP